MKLIHSLCHCGHSDLVSQNIVTRTTLGQVQENETFLAQKWPKCDITGSYSPWAEDKTVSVKFQFVFCTTQYVLLFFNTEHL